LHDLIPIEALPPGALTTAEIDATMAYAAAEKSAATHRAYRFDWVNFETWCASRGACPLPAHQGVVAAYLSHLAEAGRRASTIGRRAAAIGHRHKTAGYEQPTSQEGVRAVLRGIRRTIGSAKQGKSAATAEVLGQMLALCPNSLLGKRDRALLAFGFAGAFRRSELCALEVADLAWVDDGVRVLIRRSKGDQEGTGQEIAIPRGYRLRPVEAVQTWLDAAEIRTGLVFRSVARGGRVGAGLNPESASRLIKGYAERLGLDPAGYSGHSLRSGFLTSAAEAGASIWKLSEVSRHRSLDTLRGYVRRVDLFKEHAGAAFL
jgi:integrase